MMETAKLWKLTNHTQVRDTSVIHGDSAGKV
jgi:hypothetical protein